MAEELTDLIARLDGLAEKATARPWDNEAIYTMLKYYERNCPWDLTLKEGYNHPTFSGGHDPSLIAELHSAYPALRAAALRCAEMERIIDRLVKIIIDDSPLTFEDKDAVRRYFEQAGVITSDATPAKESNIQHAHATNRYIPNTDTMLMETCYDPECPMNKENTNA